MKEEYQKSPKPYMKWAYAIADHPCRHQGWRGKWDCPECIREVIAKAVQEALEGGNRRSAGLKTWVKLMLTAASSVGIMTGPDHWVMLPSLVVMGAMVVLALSGIKGSR